MAKTTTMWWIVCQYMGQIWFMTPIMQIPRMALSSLNVPVLHLGSQALKEGTGALHVAVDGLASALAVVVLHQFV